MCSLLGAEVPLAGEAEVAGSCACGRFSYTAIWYVKKKEIKTNDKLYSM